VVNERARFCEIAERLPSHKSTSMVIPADKTGRLIAGKLGL